MESSLAIPAIADNARAIFLMRSAALCHRLPYKNLGCEITEVLC